MKATKNYHIMKENKVNIGERIKHWRQIRNLTQDSLSKQANLPVSTVSKLESGNITDPRLSTLIMLTKALGITIDELIQE